MLGRMEFGAGPEPHPLVRAEEGFSAILRHCRDAIYVVDDQWTLVFANEAALSWWGRTAGSVIGANIWDAFPQAVGSAPYEAHLEAARERRHVTLTARSPVLGRVLEIAIEPLRSGLAVIFHEQAADVASELAHRIKNMIATFEGLVALSFGVDRPLAEARQQLLQRIGALSCTTDVVMNPAAGDLAMLARRCLAPFVPAAPERLRIEGPPVTVGPTLATTLAMALHELATNALKHGALADGQGAVLCAWRREGDALVLSWQERGAGPAVAPARPGFGLRFLKVAFRRGVSLTFDDQGFGFEGRVTLGQADGGA
jgi:PAS domain S-box-containing protein